MFARLTRAAHAGATAIFLSVTTVAVAPAPAAARDLVYGSWLPQAEYTNRVTLPHAFDELAAESDVRWRLVPGGQLVGPVDTWDALESGLVQGGMGIPSYVPSVVPTLNVLYQTVLPGEETLAATGAALQTMLVDCPACLEELRALNIVPVAGWATAPYTLGCTRPVATVGDLAGLRVRAVGGNVRLMETAGAVPVAATLVEAVTLLQTGGIDCVFGVANWYRSFGYADFLTHHTAYPMGMTGPATGWLMNRDAWLSLNDEERALHLRKGARVSAEQALGQFTRETHETLGWAEAEHGMKVVAAADPAGFAALMADFVAEQDDAVIAAAEARGVEAPGAIIAAYRANFDEWKMLTDGVETVEELTALYWERIFSRVDPGAL
jgi:TRAP-type C4-dicarboxylate transport system substrate-binding protein